MTAAEVRVLGCMMEKQLTTPDIYPLTLNGLRLACNQSTNRDPVVQYDDGVLRDALHLLERRGYARLASGRGSRAPKYRHLLAEALPLARDEHAVLCVLMLRGPQTPGELKQRSERMNDFPGLDAVHETLERLIDRGLVTRLDRRPGQKEERYQQLLSADGAQDEDDYEASTPASHPHPVSPAYPHSAPSSTHAELSAQSARPPVADGPSTQGAAAATPTASATPAEPDSERLLGLERRIARLEREVAELRAQQRPAGVV